MTDFKYHLNRNGFIGLKILTWKHGGYITAWCKSTWFSENSFIHKLPCERTFTFFLDNPTRVHAYSKQPRPWLLGHTRGAHVHVICQKKIIIAKLNSLLENFNLTYQMCPVCQSQAQTCLGKTELQTHQREALHTKRKTSIRHELKWPGKQNTLLFRHPLQNFSLWSLYMNLRTVFNDTAQNFPHELFSLYLYTGSFQYFDQ